MTALATEAGPIPAGLVAATVKVKALPFVRSVTVQVVVGARTEQD
jgi:hypothetical protein